MKNFIYSHMGMSGAQNLIVVNRFRIVVKIRLSFFSFFLAVSEVPELFRKLRGTGRIHFYKVSCKSELGVPSYDKNTETIND